MAGMTVRFWLVFVVLQLLPNKGRWTRKFVKVSVESLVRDSGHWGRTEE